MIRPITFIENLSSGEVTRLITLYTSKGFLKEYERTGKFALPYPVDHPLIPARDIIQNLDYHYYQKLL
ncbi:MAG TPA: hypothetical protein VHZ50_11025 [Puia sp.]|nr:hypothetical protein [Puia sp.]